MGPEWVGLWSDHAETASGQRNNTEFPDQGNSGRIDFDRHQYCRPPLRVPTMGRKPAATADQVISSVKSSQADSAADTSIEPIPIDQHLDHPVQTESPKSMLLSQAEIPLEKDLNTSAASETTIQPEITGKIQMPASTTPPCSQPRLRIMTAIRI